jgi:hypothetical protein
VKSLRRSGERVLTDERVLETDEFVWRVLGEAERSVLYTRDSKTGRTGCPNRQQRKRMRLQIRSLTSIM